MIEVTTAKKTSNIILFSVKKKKERKKERKEWCKAFHLQLYFLKKSKNGYESKYLFGISQGL